MATELNTTNRNTIIVRDPFDAVKLLKDVNPSNVWVIGGASIYKQSLPFVDQLSISRIPGEHTGETYFPDFSEYGFQLVEEKPFQTFTLQTYRKE